MSAQYSVNRDLTACHSEERSDDAISLYVIQPVSGAKVEIAHLHLHRRRKCRYARNDRHIVFTLTEYWGRIHRNQLPDAFDLKPSER